MKCSPVFAALGLLFVPMIALAGGPLNVCNDGARTPIKYSGAGNIVLNFDQGNLGARSKARADELVENAIAIWGSAPAATVTLTRGADLPVDVTTANLATYSVTNDGLFPVIYDSDGSIIEATFGTAAKSSVLGFAGSSFFLTPTCRYSEGRAVINGFASTSDTTFGVTIAHEIGHLIGMDHTQLDSAQGLANSARPLMYPTASRTSVSLHEDDESAVSALYPDTGVGTVYGELSGNFVLADGVTAVRGANLWATEINSGRLYSIVSDYRTQNTGFFRLLLPPGQYNLRAEAIRTSFMSGSSVGPYSDNATDVSFQPPLYTGVPATPMATLTLGNAVPTVININAGCLATATFRFDGTGTVGGNCVTPTTFPLTVSKLGIGAGTVTSNVGGINCGTTCLASLADSTMVTLTATASGGAFFNGWGGACSGTGSCVVTMNQARTVTAIFIPPEVFPANCQFPVDYSTPAGSTTGWSSATDRARSGFCSLKSNPMANASAPGQAASNKARIQVTGDYQAGNVSFYYNVSSEAGWDCFRFLIDGVQQAIDGSCADIGGIGASGDVSTWTLVSIPVSAGNHTFVWSYEKDDQVTSGADAAWIDDVALPALQPVTLTVSRSGTGTGTVTSNPAGINCGADCSEGVTPGTAVTLTATPNANSSFTGWSGGGCSGTGACVVTVSTATTVTATFTLNQFALTITRAGAGTGTVTSSPAGINCGSDCTENYNVGTVVTLTATPAMGSTFAGWSGGGCAGTGSCAVTINMAATVTATFNIAAVPPGAPTLNSVTAGNTQATAFFTAPASSGSSPITLYTVQCPDLAAVQPTVFNTGTSSPITVMGMVNGVTYRCGVIATSAAGGSAPSNLINVTPSASPALGLVSVDSRKTHGGVIEYRLPISVGPALNGAISVEPRTGSTHKLVFTFNATITSVVSATSSVGTASVSFSGTEVAVVLSGVPDNSRVAVTLNNVNGSVNATANVGFLVGDVSNSRGISAVDIAALKARSGTALTASPSDPNARFDVTTNGNIGNADITAVKSKSGVTLVP
jgi:hypothetical protein